MIAIIDYDAGNIRSVEKALLALGQTPVITRDPAVLFAAEKVILPGVGAFGDAMGRIREYGLEEAVERVCRASRQYAKRQLTWLRRNPAIHWILWEKERDFVRALQIATEIWTASGLQ